MEIKGSLTNEKVCKKFKSQFDLVNYAIRLAENMIRTGRDTRVRIDSQNRALQVLCEIVNDKDQFDEIIEVEPVQFVEKRNERFEDSKNSYQGKTLERKKSRKIFAGQ